jgi:hypothetical protein
MNDTLTEATRGLVTRLFLWPVQRFVEFMDDVDEVWDLDDPFLTDDPMSV